MMDKIVENGLTWINIIDPVQKDLDYLSKNYNFHLLDLEDCLSKVQRPKFEDYDDYKFLVLHFPSMQVKGYRVEIAEADIFLGEDYIITLHSKRLSKLRDIFDSLGKDSKNLKKFFSKGPDYLLYNILHEIYLKVFELMNRINLEIDFLDTSFDKIKPVKIIERISVMRRNIIFLQTSLKPQKSIFTLFENQLLDSEEMDMDIYWGDIGDYISKLLDMAEDYQELIDGVYSSIDTLLTYRVNNNMKTLTLFSVIMMPLTFITGFYGMNIRLPFQNMSSNSLLATGIVSGIMLSITVFMLIYFKIKRF